MSGRARRNASAILTRPARRTRDLLWNGYGIRRQGTPSCSQSCTTGPGLLKPQTSTAACSCSTKCLARMSACRSAPPSSRLNNTKTMRRPLRVESGVKLRGGSAFFGKRGTHLLQNGARSRIAQFARVDDLAIANQNAQFAKTASHGFDVNSVLFSQLRRHPGGDEFLADSNRTTADDYLFHDYTSFRPAALTVRPARRHFRKASYR